MFNFPRLNPARTGTQSGRNTQFPDSICNMSRPIIQHSFHKDEAGF
jgi:hypothetical protein